jgi:uncharacterized membrane-anchored protein
MGTKIYWLQYAISIFTSEIFQLHIKFRIDRNFYLNRVIQSVKMLAVIIMWYMQISNLHYKPIAHTHVKRWRIVSKMCLEQASSVLVNKLHGNRQCKHSYEQTADVQTGAILNWRINLFKMAHKKQFYIVRLSERQRNSGNMLFSIQCIK